MTLGAPGASWIQPAVLQVSLNVLDWGMGIQEAIMAPRMVATSNVIDISNRMLRRTERGLVEKGYSLRRTHISYAFAGVHGITMWPDGLEGVSVTPILFRRVEKLLLLVTGEGKREIINRLIKQPSSIPAGTALAEHPAGELWTDRHNPEE